MKISGALLRDMFVTGAALLEKNKAHIDSLNVFPVPDGDTGTNMSMTMQSAVKEMKDVKGETVGDIAQAAALGSLKGARGNSGVILSQILRGFSKALSGASEMDAAMLALALRTGTEAAYKAVMKPKEGTILTVSRVMSDAVAQASAEGANVYKLMDVMLESGEEALRRTPELLPVLKEAGVVDAGGKGFLTILRGFKMALDGEDIDDLCLVYETSPIEEEDAVILGELEDIRFGYCTEFFIIHLDAGSNEAEVDKFREKLAKIGDSAVVVTDAGLIKVHVHSNCPGKIIQLALRLGEVNNIKIDNMREQNREQVENLKKSERESAMVAVSVGEGIEHVFSELGVSVCIQGGQTMNPSIEAIGKAIRRANARNVFVLPNNSNIILAAQQAAELASCKVHVVPSKTMVQGIAAAVAFSEDAEAGLNFKRMSEAIRGVVSGSLTYAIRDSQFNGTRIEKGNIVAMLDEDIIAAGDGVDAVALTLLRRMIPMREDPVVTLLYGENMDEENANALVRELEPEFPDAEFVVQNGGQPIYYYYFSVE